MERAQRRWHLLIYRIHVIGNVGQAVTFWRDETDKELVIWPLGLRGVALHDPRAEPSASASAGSASASRAAQRVAAAAGANRTGWPRGRAIGQHEPQR
jgi:hypothetical protein